MDKLNLAEELRNAGRDCNPISQATWSAWERGYKQAVDDIKNKLIKIE